MGPPVTTQKIAVTLFVNCIFGIPLGFLWWAQLKKSYANLRKSLKLDVWGTGIFDDGAACDVINTVIHKDQSIDVLIRKALSTLNNDTIECTQGYEVIVASAMSSAILNKTSYSEIDDLDTWLSKQDTASVLHHKADLVNALKRILSDQSDLNEIWSENADDYPVWRSNIEKLVEALVTASS